jgi:putative spermidine/putrescine transport system ATP-binding protein
MSFLELDRVAKQFGPQTVVDDFSLTVGKGEFVSFLGPSGCGKTTTLQMIAGFLDPSRGAIRLEGRDLTAVQPAKRGLGIVFQSYALFPHMTAAENVAFGLEMRRVPRSECAERVRATLAMVGLAGYEDRYPRRMSGGQQQRVALARALVIRPSVLLLDEPLSNLDAKLREEMQIELRQIQRNLGTTTILPISRQDQRFRRDDRSDRRPGAAGRRLLERACACWCRRSRDGQHPPRADRLRRCGSGREDRHPHLPGQSLAVSVRERMRLCNCDPPKRRPAAAR